MLVSCCVRSRTIFSNRNRECATVRSERRSKRRERDGGSAQAARRREDRGGSYSRLFVCFLFAVCLLSPLLREDVIGQSG